MSYILDALRRADAERERKRGAVPSLQTQQHSLVPEEDEAAARSRWLVPTLALVAAALIAVVAWLLLGDRTPAPAARTLGEQMAAATPSVPPPRPMSLSEIAAAPAPALTAPPPAPLPTTPAPPPAPLPQARSSTTPATRPARTSPIPAAALPSTPRSVAPTPAPATANAPSTSNTSANANATESRIVAQAELPDAVRRELPALAFAGASYSGDAASRMVIINGQVFHEGDTIARGLVLQQIRLRTAVLAFKGYRYEVTY